MTQFFFFFKSIKERGHKKVSGAFVCCLVLQSPLFYIQLLPLSPHSTTPPFPPLFKACELDCSQCVRVHMRRLEDFYVGSRGSPPRIKEQVSFSEKWQKNQVCGCDNVIYKVYVRLCALPYVCVELYLNKITEFSQYHWDHFQRCVPVHTCVCVFYSQDTS